jgi:hypothetical protein
MTALRTFSKYLVPLRELYELSYRLNDITLRTFQFFSYRNFMKPFLFIIGLTLFAACGVTLVVPTQSDVDRVAGRYPDYSLTELREGKKIYEQHCDACHRLKDPGSRSVAKWGNIVPEMTTKVNRKAGREVIDANKQELLLRYLITMGPGQRGK